jgi:hypothetical protein
LPYKPSELLGRLFLELSVVHALVVGSMPRSVEYALEALDVFEFERHGAGCERSDCGWPGAPSNGASSGATEVGVDE